MISPLAPLLFGVFPLHRAICRKQTTQNEARAWRELTLPAAEPRPGREKHVGREPERSQDPWARGMSSVQPSTSFLSSPPDLQIPHWFKLSLPKACKLVRTSKREKKKQERCSCSPGSITPCSRLTSPHFERSSPWKERQREQKQTWVLLEILASDTSLSLKIFKLGIPPQLLLMYSSEVCSICVIFQSGIRGDWSLASPSIPGAVPSHARFMHISSANAHTSQQRWTAAYVIHYRIKSGPAQLGTS